MKGKKIINGALINQSGLLVLLKKDRWLLPGGYERYISNIFELVDKIHYMLPGIRFEIIKEMPVFINDKIGKYHVELEIFPFELKNLPRETNINEGILKYAIVTGREEQYKFSPLMKKAFHSLESRGYLKKI